MRLQPVRLIVTTLACLALTAWYFVGRTAPVNAVASGRGPADNSIATSLKTRTPIKHLVVIFQENVSFDHYFATYPHALNPPGEPPFHAAPNTPAAYTLESAGLLAPNNPNSIQPFRLDRSQALTCDQNHDYTPEQRAANGGLEDKFVENTDTGGSPGNSAQYCPKGVTMGYFDGNTVTAIWNYAQHYAINDNSFGTVFGPSTPGVLNLIAGDTAGAVCGPTSSDVVYQSPGACSPTSALPTSLAAATASGTVVGDPDQYYDKCSSGGYGSAKTAAVETPNIGDLLNASHITWGWFNGGFDNCSSKHAALAYDRAVGTNPASDPNGATGDYSAHHEGFQYFASTSNPQHLPPSSVAMIGQTDQANHQYDLNDFIAAANADNLPAVSFLKAPKYQDGHAGYSDPLDEQAFLVNTINVLMSGPSWKSTAIIISYDDSDGWYDHLAGPIVNHSNTSLDVNCGSSSDGAPARCGYGPHLPYLVISPYARVNYVDHSLTDQTSTLRFIEDNWLNFKRLSSESFDRKAVPIMGMFDWNQHLPWGDKLILNPVTGEPY